MEEIVVVGSNPCRIRPFSFDRVHRHSIQDRRGLAGHEQRTETDTRGYTYLRRAHSRYGLYWPTTRLLTEGPGDVK